MSDKKTFSSVCLVLLLLLGTGTILFMAPGPFLGNASGLVINGVYSITGTETYDEDITISSTGHLRIVDGGTLKLGIGHIIFVNGGALSVLGNSSVRSKITCSAMGGRFGGIVANRDARLNFTYANLQWADEMLVCDGTGRAGSAGHVYITESWFSMSTRGLRFGDGVPSHPYDVRFVNDRVQTTQTALAITTAYNDISITGSELFSSQGTAVDIFGGGGGGGAGRIRDCSISGEVSGLSVTNHQKMEIGNCSISGYRALRLEKLYGFYVHNNTATSKYRGMYCYSIEECTFENNAFNALSYTTSIAVELEQTTDIEFHDNILSSHGFAMTMNLSSGDIVEMNLLTNLLGKDYRDLDGNGFCDTDPLLPGNAAMYARRCRTSIVPLDGTGPTFVNPKMATDFADEGDKLFMYCFPKDYGPQGNRFRSLIHTEMPYFERPLHLMGEEMESLWFLPPEGAAGPVFMAVDDASLSNVTIGSTKYGTNIDTSSNVTVSDITYGYLLFFGGDGLTAARSNDVDMVRIRSTFENSPLVQLNDCDRVTLDRPLSVWESGNEVIAKDCSDLRISEMETSLHSGNAIVLDHCSGRVERCKLDSAYSSLVMESCHDMVVSFMQFYAGYYPEPIIAASNLTAARFEDLDLYVNGKGSDYRAVELTYDVRDVFFSRCIFSNDQPPNATGLYVNGLASDVRLSDCFFFNLSCGVYLEEAGDGRSSVRDPPGPMASGHQLERCDFHNNDVGVDFRGATSLRLAGNTLWGGGIGFQAMGDLDLVGNTFHGGMNVGVKVSEWGITASRLNSVGTQFLNFKGTLETAYELRKTQFLIKENWIESPVGIRSVGCNGSMAVHTNFLNGVPIIVSPLTDEVSSVELNDCEGDRTRSVSTDDGCTAVWTYSLNITVLNEVGDLQPSEVMVTTAMGQVVFDGTTDGTERLQSVVGFIKRNTTSDYSMNDYRVEASDGDGYNDEHINMTKPQSVIIHLSSPVRPLPSSRSMRIPPGRVTSPLGSRTGTPLFIRYPASPLRNWTTSSRGACSTSLRMLTGTVLENSLSRPRTPSERASMPRWT
ncbi:MAG: right-handed parallel beta-helix repeat-containing protein [Candidatus Thermoplasmatota archaeon]|nr:right-handed parallel beta-helix repeat-containing protein [Candidatus Thermoplasmatota archaeon]